MRYPERLPSEQELTRLRSEWPGRGWTWDSRYGCVVSSFSAVAGSDYQEVIARTFPTHWTRRTVAKAPAGLQRLLVPMDGLRDSQLVYTPRECGEEFAAVLWWPWGDDLNISARVVVTDDSEPCIAAFRAAFKVEL